MYRTEVVAQCLNYSGKKYFAIVVLLYYTSSKRRVQIHINKVVNHFTP